jgi:hypothetical protein
MQSPESQNRKNANVSLIINRAANPTRSVSRDKHDMKMMVTQANEVLAKDGIHGRIASVGVGFGTGRHTANVFSRHAKKPQA